jgi:hypothetical protein
MSVNFQKIAPIFAVCVGTGGMLMNYGSYTNTLKELHFKVEAQEKKVNSVDILTNEMVHLKESINELKIDLKSEFSGIKVDIKEIKQNVRM